jgi:hypothetical protein
MARDNVMQELDPGPRGDEDNDGPIYADQNQRMDTRTDSRGDEQVVDIRAFSDRGRTPDRNQQDDRNDTGNVEDEFQIIDADDRFRPIEKRGADDSGEQSLLDQRNEDDGRDQTVERKTHAARQRERRRLGRDLTQQENARLAAKVAELEQQVAGIAPRLRQMDVNATQGQIADLDRRMTEAASRKNILTRQLHEASVAGDSDAYSQLMDQRDAALVEAQQLAAHKANLTNALEQAKAGGIGPNGGDMRRTDAGQRQQQGQSPLPTPAQEYVREFTEAYPWFNPQNPNSIDSVIVSRIDNAVAGDGFNPSTQEYWDEIDYRMRQAPQLRHVFAQESRQVSDNRGGQDRFDNGRDQRAPARQQQRQTEQVRRGPPVAASGGRDVRQGQSKPAVYLTQGRKEALELAGAIGRDGKVADPAKFRGYMKQFSKWDRENLS